MSFHASSVTPKARRPNPANAFSLIEIAIALLVMSVGILALLGLFPSGVQMSRDAYETTRIVQFAESVFNTIELELMKDSRLWETTSWTTNSQGRQIYSPGAAGGRCFDWTDHTFAVARPHYDDTVWTNESDLVVHVTGGSGIQLNRYKSTQVASLTRANTDELVEFAFRYRLSLTQVLSSSDTIVELLAAPQNHHLYTDNSNCGGWSSATDRINGRTPIRYAPEGGPVWERDFWTVRRTNPQEYRRASRDIIVAELMVIPGEYGLRRKTNRSFHRYFFRY